MSRISSSLRVDLKRVEGWTPECWDWDPASGLGSWASEQAAAAEEGRWQAIRSGEAEARCLTPLRVARVGVA